MLLITASQICLRGFPGADARAKVVQHLDRSEGVTTGYNSDRTMSNEFVFNILCFTRTAKKRSRDAVKFSKVLNTAFVSRPPRALVSFA